MDYDDYGVDYDYDDDYAGVDNFEAEEEVENSRNSPNFQVLSVEDLQREQQDAIKNVAQLYEVPEHTARQLLTYVKWNRDHLMERYGEDGNIYKQSGIVNPMKKKKLKRLDQKSVLECSICFCETKVSHMKRIACGHIFCKECWLEYIKLKIYENTITEIRCPSKGCKTLLDDDTILKIISKSTELKDKYHRLLTEAYVRDNKNVRWCPGRGCEKAIRVQLLKDKEIICSCGTKFCFQCGELPHAPADCNMVKEWNKKCKSDGDDAKWMATYTKECPKCKSTIHKDGGCQYMTCITCSHRFCWMCLGAFDHKDHACNKLQEEVGVDPSSERAKLNKYIFFYTRYHNHQQSIDLEAQLNDKANLIMKQLSDKGTSWIDVQFIKQATQTLMECRNMLKYTYVYGYYLPKNVNRSIFEYLQADLEAAVEKLSELLEARSEKDRLKVINSSEYVRQRQKNLLQGLLEGEITGKGGDTEEKKYKNEVVVYDGWVYKAGN